MTASIGQLIGEIDTTVTLGHGTPINLAYTLLRIIEKSERADQAELVRHACDVYDNAESSSEINIGTFMSDNESKQLENKYGDLVNKMLDLVLAENPLDNDFYESIASLLQNPLFRDEKARAFAFHYILIDKRIPYFHLESGLRMSDEDWRATIRRLTCEQAKLRFILATDFSQRSEKVDLVLKEIERIENYEDRVALMYFVIFEIDQARSMAQRLSQMAKA